MIKRFQTVLSLTLMALIILGSGPCYAYMDNPISYEHSACQQDSECVSKTFACCPCQRDDNAVFAVNVKYASLYSFKCTASEIHECSEQGACVMAAEISAQCHNQQCVVQITPLTR